MSPDLTALITPQMWPFFLPMANSSILVCAFSGCLCTISHTCSRILSLTHTLSVSHTHPLSLSLPICLHLCHSHRGMCIFILLEYYICCLIAFSPLTRFKKGPLRRPYISSPSGQGPPGLSPPPPAPSSAA